MPGVVRVRRQRTRGRVERQRPDPLRPALRRAGPRDHDGVLRWSRYGEPWTYVVGTLEAYLQRNTRHREPTIWIGKGESREGVTLTIAKAAEVARTLLAMVEATR